MKRTDFLNELRASTEALRQTLTLDTLEDLKPTEKAREERLAKAREDFAFFCETYFPHYLTLKEPNHFHAWVDTSLFPLIKGKASGLRSALAAPRGNAKSTKITRLLTLYQILFGKRHYCVIVMDSERQAQAMLESIKAELEVNQRIAFDFPEASGIGPVWNVKKIITNR